jgi:ADP-glucose pyrophosphorylase
VEPEPLDTAGAIRFAADAVLVDSLVGPGAELGAGATLVRSVVLRGAVVAAGAQVTDSVVMGRVGEGADVRDSVVGADGVVAPHEHVHGERRPDPDAG